MSTIVFLIHGLGPVNINSMALAPLEWYLRKSGFNKTHRIRYPVNESDLNEMIDHVDNEMSKQADKDNDHVILIGQSMGGVVANNMHKRGWNIKHAIYIGSPLRGARLLNQLDNILPTTIRNFCYKKPYGYLMDKAKEPSHDLIPPHNFHTISMSWPLTSFDGCVYRDEATIDESKHTHLAWADHRTIFLNPRLWFTVANILN